MRESNKLIKKMLKGCLTGSCLTGMPNKCEDCKYVKWSIKKFGINIIQYFEYKDLIDVEKNW